MTMTTSVRNRLIEELIADGYSPAEAAEEVAQMEADRHTAKDEVVA